MEKNGKFLWILFTDVKIIEEMSNDRLGKFLIQLRYV